MLLDRDGNLVIADAFNNCVRRVGVDGIIHTIAGTCGQAGFSGDGLAATGAKLNAPQDMALGPDGTLYVSDNGNARIRAIAPSGIITTIAGTGVFGYSGDNGPSLEASFNPPQYHWGVALSHDGQFLYIADGTNNVVRRLALPQPGFNNAAFAVASSDGSQLLSFDPFGRHLATNALPTAIETLRLGYTTSGQLQTLTDADGNVTTVQRDGSGNPTAVVSAFGPTTTLHIGTDGYLASLTGPAGAQYEMAYTNGLLTEIQFPTGSSTVQSNKQYDALGHLTTSADAAGHTLTFNRVTDTPTALNVTKTTSAGVVTTYERSLSTTLVDTRTNLAPDGTVETEVFSPSGIQTVTAADGTKTVYTPGPDPRFGMQSPVTASQTITLPVSKLVQTRSTSRSVTLSSPQNPLSVVSETDTTTINGLSWTTTYAAGPPATLTTLSPVGRTVTTTLDGTGHPTKVVVPSIAATTNLYDLYGRLQSTTQGTFVQGTQTLQRTWQTAYDPNGYVGSTTDPLDVQTTFENDLAGRPTTTLLPNGNGGTRTLLQSFDGDDNLTSVTLPNGNLHQLNYTPVDALQTYTPPALGTTPVATQYTYDADGRIYTEVRPDGSTIVYGYDPVTGQLKTSTYPQGVLTRAYSTATGQLQTLTAPSGVTLTYAFDGFLPSSTTWSGSVAGSLVLGYDSTFRIATQTLNGASLSFGYDNDNLMTGAGAITIHRDPQTGRIITTVLGSIGDTVGYDANGQFASYTAAYNGTLLYSETVNLRDGDGRIVERTEVVGSTTHVWQYTYDTAGRLTTASEDGASPTIYGYDADDNRIAVTGPGISVAPTYDAQDRLVSYGAASYTFGANGELQSKATGSQTTGYVYDVFGNLLHVALPSGTALDYVVDGENRRVGKQAGGALTTGYLYQDALHVVAQLNGSGNVVARFVFGSKPNVPDYYTNASGTFRILSDHLGSPRLVVNTSSGAVVEEIDYDEFGNVTNDTAPGTIPFGFAGGLYDVDTGLVRFGARDYDPSVGRWTSKDPVRFHGSSLSLYGYVLNDPVNRVDPGGTQTISIPWWLIAGGEGAEVGGETGALGGPFGAAVGVVVGAGVGICLAYASDNSGDQSGEDDCDEQWRAAYEECGKIITNPSGRGGANRNIAGGYTNVEDCAKGLVSSRPGTAAIQEKR
jgi:RHS repeat-associated protein